MTKQKTIAVSPEVYAAVKELAQAGGRKLGAQVAHMVSVTKETEGKPVIHTCGNDFDWSKFDFSKLRAIADGEKP